MAHGSLWTGDKRRSHNLDRRSLRLFFLANLRLRYFADDELGCAALGRIFRLGLFALHSTT